ncbi:MAG: molybdopterin converting factor subunit 1 [Pseudomonadota bacterium]|nr:molybdopterin converting factor subunit 1 [Pseudomonadota bacterium]
MTLTIRYFAWMREHTGTDLETVSLPDNVSSVGDLVQHLVTMSDGHEQALKNMRAVRVAVNRTYGDLDTPVAGGDEVAFFPPVTGG